MEVLSELSVLWTREAHVELEGRIPHGIRYDRNLDLLGDLADPELEPTLRSHVLLARPRAPVAGAVRHGARGLVAADPRHRDAHLALVLGAEEHGRAELQDGGRVL